MAELDITKYGVSMKFGNGTTSTGATRIMSVSIGTLDRSRYNRDKAFALAGDLSYAYSQMLVRIEETCKGDLVYGE